MKTWAVGIVDYFGDGEFSVQIVEAETWLSALQLHADFKLMDGTKNILKLEDDIEEAKDEAYEYDWMFDVVEIKNGKIPEPGTAA